MRDFLTSQSDLPPAVEYLAHAAMSAPSADNSQPWCYTWDGHTLRFYVRRRGGFPEDAHGTLLALGAVAENLAQATAELHHAPAICWFGAPGETRCFAEIGVTKSDEQPPSLGAPPWLVRHTNRHPYHREVPEDFQSAAQYLREQDVYVKPLDHDLIASTAKWVHRASKIRFRTQEIHEWFAASLRYGKSEQARQEGLHIDTLALPPGGAMLLKLCGKWSRMRVLNRVGAYRLFAAVEAAGYRQAPYVAAIIGPPGKEHAFHAGRLLERVWLTAARAGLSGQPYYVVSDLLARLEAGSVPREFVSDAARLRDEIGGFLGPGLTLHCLLRLGKPTRTTPFSGRLPLKQIRCT